MNLKNTNAKQESRILTHPGHETNKFSKDSSSRPIDLLHLITDI